MQDTPDHSETPPAQEGPAAEPSAVLIKPEESPPPQPPAATVPEDLRVPWDGLDLLLFFLVGFGAMLLVAIGLQTAFSLLLPPMDPAIFKNIFAITHQVVWSLAMMLYLVVLMRARFRAPFWLTIGFRAFRSGELAPGATYLATVAGGMLLAIGVQIVAAVLDRFVHRPEQLPIEGLFQSRPSAMLMMVSAIVVAPLVEEVMFRGFLYPVIARRLGMTTGVLITGTLFGLMHAGQLWGGWGQIGLLVAVGWVMTYVRARTGSVLASYLLHLGYNALLLIGFFLATSGLKNLPAPK